eukprot:m.349891 g.349891  ORF g.349891 m.349891 type:complete len:119 (+) comp44906_c0_seq1:175-531(+)
MAKTVPDSVLSHLNALSSLKSEGKKIEALHNSKEARNPNALSRYIAQLDIQESGTNFDIDRTLWHPKIWDEDDHIDSLLAIEDRNYEEKLKQPKTQVQFVSATTGAIVTAHVIQKHNS